MIIKGNSRSTYSEPCSILGFLIPPETRDSAFQEGFGESFHHNLTEARFVTKTETLEPDILGLRDSGCRV